MLASCGGSESGSESGGGLFQAGGSQAQNYFNIQLNSANTFIEAQNIDITLTHSYVLNITGSPRIPVVVGGETVFANFLSGDNTKSLVFRYTVQAGDEDLDGIEIADSIDLNGGSINYTVNGVVTNATTSIPSINSSHYFVDTVSPQVEAITIPANGSYKSGDTLSIVIEYNEALSVVGSSKLEIDINGITTDFTLSNHNGDQLTYEYPIQSGDDDSDGLSFSNSSITLNSGSIVDSGGNSANLNLNSLISLPSLSSIFIDTVAPTVSIDTAPAINISNASSYSISGSCSEEGENIDISFEDVNTSVICTGGIWNSGSVDISGEADSSNFSLTATQTDEAGNTTTDTVMVNKDTTVVTVAINAPVTINSSNVTNYTLSGTCSADTVLVDVFIGGLNFQTNCASGNWSFTGLDVLAEADNASLGITVDHSTATQASATVIKDTSSPEVSTITVPSDDSYKEADVLSFTIGFNEVVNVTSGMANLSIGLGAGTVQAAYTSGSGSTDLVFQYTIQAGENDSDGLSFASSNIAISSGSFVDANGNTIDLALDKNISLPSMANIFVDTFIPTVTLDTPADITAANVSSYTVTGTCSENGRTINLVIGTMVATAACSGGSFSSGALDVSSESDSASFTITADLDDIAGNSATQATATVDKNTTLPTVTIDSYPDIDQINVSAYSASGTCSENGQIVVLNIGSVNIQPNCAGGTWSISNVDVSSLAEGSVSFTADHESSEAVSATQASRTINKNTSGPTVSISSASDINGVNETSYTVTGTCSEPGRTVEVYIDTIYLTPNCNGGGWTTGSQDVSSLVDGGINITADHDNASAQVATQATRTVIKNTSGPSITTLSAPTTLTNAVNLSWNFVNPSANTIDDYIINYRIKGSSTWLLFSDGTSTATTAQVTGLLASTTYEFQVAIAYDSTEQSSFSQSVEAETQPDSDLFAGDYIFLNVGGASTTRIVALDDNTRVYLNDTEIADSPLSAGQVSQITTSRYDKLEGDKPIYAAGLATNGGGAVQDNGNVMWIPTSWAGKNFNFNATRNNPQVVFIYAVENATITAKEGNTVLDSAILTAGQSTNLSWSNFGSYQITSTGTILAFSQSGGTNFFYDVKPLLPSSLEIIGFPSNSMRLTTDIDNTNYTYIHSNSNSGSGVLDKVGITQINPQGTGSTYQSESLLISADQKIAGASYADSNGYCAAPFLPTSMMKKRYAINTNSDYVAFASKEPGTIDVYSPGQTVGVDTPVTTINLTRSGANSNAPYHARLANQSSGYRFISNVNMAAWYQPNSNIGAADEDETILVGFD